LRIIPKLELRLTYGSNLVLQSVRKFSHSKLAKLFFLFKPFCETAIVFRAPDIMSEATAYITRLIACPLVSGKKVNEGA